MVALALLLSMDQAALVAVLLVKDSKFSQNRSLLPLHKEELFGTGVGFGVGTAVGVGFVVGTAVGFGFVVSTAVGVGFVVGKAVGVGFGFGAAVGVGFSVGLGIGVGVGFGVGPLVCTTAHFTPFTEIVLGSELVPEKLPMKPKSTVAPVATFVFQLALVTVTCFPF
jgi:hypothetical protein